MDDALQAHVKVAKQGRIFLRSKFYWFVLTCGFQGQDKSIKLI